MIELNRIYSENCIDTMAKMPDNFIDLTVTSPPYDNMRFYNGYTFPFGNIANELYRITKVGGVVVWVVGDATIEGSESGTSYKQALYFINCGFNLETMIWKKTGSGCLGSNKYYAQNFEFMFILSKGVPKTTNLICDRKNIKKAGTKTVTNGGLNAKGEFKRRNIVTVEYGKRTNVWEYDTQKNSDHPAPFPEQLAADHIYTWSNEGDIIYDPFSGSGTTCKMAQIQKRKWVASEISEEYANLSEKRIAPYLAQTVLF